MTCPYYPVPISMMTSSKKGVSAHQLHRTLETPIKQLGFWRIVFVRLWLVALCPPSAFNRQIGSIK